MLPNLKTYVPVPQPWERKEIFMPKSQIKYSERDYEIGNKDIYEKCNAQERLADRMIAESNRVMDEVAERTSNWKRETDHQIQERIDEVQFLYDELIKQKKAAALENEALDTSNKRLKNALKIIERAISMSKQCLLYREGRLGIDLCVDEVEKKLLHELKTFKGAQSLLERANKETIEQMRSLREAIYQLDEDIKQKLSAIQIDKNNLVLRESFSTLGEGIDRTRNFCKYTLAEWQDISDKNIKKNAKEMANASALRAYVDLILNQVYQDLRNATEDTNHIFKRRIEETTKYQHTLEEKHSNCTRSTMDVLRIIQNLGQQLAETERSLLLCQTRLSNRTFRVDQELTCDFGQQTLLQEQNALQVSLCKLKQKLDENKGVMRYLMHTIIVTEEDINIKANSLKIDEVDCMTLRQTLQFVPF